MKTSFKLIAFILIGLVVACGFSFLTDKSKFGQWTIRNGSDKTTELSWINFYWTNENFGNKQYERTAMFVPAKIQGLPYTFSFQFDLGSDVTMIYERNAKTILKSHSEIGNRIGKLKSPLQFWNSQKSFKNLTLDFGGIKAYSENCYVKKEYGQEVLGTLSASTPIQIGTIGADLFQGKVLILDYPNERFTICDSLPTSFNSSLTDIELDNSGRVILPLTFHGKTYRALFDNGSSLFPLLITEDKIDNFSTLPATDTIKVSSWGTTHKFIGRPLKNNFQLGGQNFADILVYADFRKEAKTNSYDAIAGNALFWNRTVVIDFKNKKFGLK